MDRRVTQSSVPYGSWPSPITADLAARGMTAGQIAAPSCLGFQGEELWWIEPRPQEEGRAALVRKRHPDTEGAVPRPLTPVSPVGGGLRWAEPEVDLARGAVRCVLEEFTGEGPSDVRRLIAEVPLDGSAAEDRSAVRELSDDRHRFVSGARVSPDG